MGNRTIVAYFSASGVTEKYAKRLAKELDADIFEIVPTQLYSRDDLNWNDKKSRSYKEMLDETIRPQISERIENIDDYDTVFVGYPIWWEKAPNIIFTFLENYDFSGKTIVPFATSGGSVKGSKGTHLHKFCSSDTKWVTGKLLNCEEDIVGWYN